MKLYYEDKYKKELQTKIIDIFFENEKCFIRLENSIFYPQGGGQKGDRGYLIIDGKKYNILNSIKDENYNSILMMEDSINQKYINKDINCYLDWEFRYKQMRLHTSLHLIHAIIEEVKGSKLDYPLISTIEDGFAYNKYDENSFDISILTEVEDRFYKLAQTDNEVITYPDVEKEHYRYWQCMNYKIPCGGIHISKLSEIGKVKIETSHKKKTITIKISLE